MWKIRYNPYGQMTLIFRACDQPRPAIARDVVVYPLAQHQKPVLESHQVEKVNEKPGEPGEQAGEADRPQIGDSSRPPYSRQVALVPVVKRIRLLAP